MAAMTYLALGYAFLHFISDRHMTDETMQTRTWIVLIWPITFVMSLLINLDGGEE